jgi:1-acyl-sn-glycerol-3-phosphate acyltransferase
MDIFKKIFGRVWAVWGLLLFVVTMFIFFIPFLIFGYFRAEPEKTKVFISFSRVWMRVFLTGIGCPLTVKGKENFAAGETYIVVCNHNSFMDVPIASPFIPGGNKTIAKIEISKIPVFGILYKTGSVLVDRKSEASRRESFGKMKDVLDMGLHMCIYPEGTRNNTDLPLKTFHNGAFILAIDTKKSIMPALIFNSRQTLPPDQFFSLIPNSLAMHFLQPVPVEPDDTVESLKQRVFEIMYAYYSANKK